MTTTDFTKEQLLRLADLENDAMKRGEEGFKRHLQALIRLIEHGCPILHLEQLAIDNALGVPPRSNAERQDAYGAAAVKERLQRQIANATAPYLAYPWLKEIGLSLDQYLGGIPMPPTSQRQHHRPILVETRLNWLDAVRVVMGEDSARALSYGIADQAVADNLACSPYWMECQKGDELPIEAISAELQDVGVTYVYSHGLNIMEGIAFMLANPRCSSPVLCTDAWREDDRRCVLCLSWAPAGNLDFAWVHLDRTKDSKFYLMPTRHVD
jgi:hypothetical protein